MKISRISQIIILIVMLLAPRGFDYGWADEPNEVPLAPLDAQNVDYIGHIGGEVYAVVAQGDYVLIGEGLSLTILDVSNPGEPQVIGRTEFLPDTVMDVAIAGDYAFLADREGGLRIIDLTDPANLFEVGFIDTLGFARSVAVAGGYVYVADYDYGLRVIDVADPANPYEVGYYDSPDIALDVALEGKYAYLADGDAGLRVIDVSDPAQPREVGYFATSLNTQALVVVNGFVYLGDNNHGLRVIDVSDPSDPVEMGFYATDLFFSDVVLAGDYIYAVTGLFASSELLIFDISDPLNLRLAGSWETYYVDMDRIAVVGSYAYLSQYGGLTVIDVTDPTNLVFVGGYGAPDYFEAVEVAGDFAYLAAGDYDGYAGEYYLILQVYDISNPAIPKGVDSDCCSVVDVALVGNYAYLAGYGLRVVDIADPYNPNVIGAYVISDTVQAVAVSGDDAFVAGLDFGLVVIDVSDPASPLEMGFYDSPGSASGVAVEGVYAYLADGEGGLRVVDVSDPANPFEVGFYNTPGYAYGVALEGDHAYVADGNQGLRVIDVTDPTNPFEVGLYDTPGIAQHVVVERDYAYLADGEYGMRVIDVSDPSSPLDAGYFDTLGEARDVAVVGSFAIVASGYGGLFILKYTGVRDASSTTIFRDQPDPSIVNGPFTVRVEVDAGFGVPSGEVMVTVDGEIASCSATLVGGIASCQLMLEAPGTYTFTATYSGDNYFLPSVSAAITHTVITPALFYLPLVSGDL